MAQLYTNNAYGVLASSIGPSDTTITLMSGDGARFPNPGGGDFFLLTLIALDGNASEASWEIVRVTARSSDTLTVVRGQEGTTGLIWPAASRAELRATAGTFSQLAPLASPALTGTPTAPTPSVGTNTTQIATTAYVRGEVAALVASAPGTLDTLNELATALGNDPNFATTVTNSLAGKAPLTGAGTSGTWGISITGNAASATRLINLRTINGVGFDGTADITIADGTKLPLAGGTLTGELYVPNLTVGGQGRSALNAIGGNIGATAGSWNNAQLELKSTDAGTVALAFHRAGYTSNTIEARDGNGLRIDGSFILHAGNYNSYALPLTGGTLTGALTAPNFRDAAGEFNVSLGSGATAGRGAAAGYSGGAYGGIGFNLRHTATSEQYIAVTGDTVSYLRFDGGGFRFFGSAAGAAGRTVTFSAPGNAYLDLSGNWYTAGQMYATGSQHLVLNTGNYNSYSPTLTGGNASGTWTINVTGNAATATLLGSYDLRTIAPSSQTASRIGTGFTSWANNNTSPWADYIHLRSYSDSSGGNDNLVMFRKDAIGMRIWQQSFGSGSAYSSYVDVLHSGNYNSYSPTLGGVGATGNWAINVSGSSNSVVGLTLTSSANGINPDNVTQNQLGYNTSVSLFGQNDGGLYSSAFSSSWVHQIYGDFRTGQIAIRGKNSGSWQPWRTVLDSGNYNSYSPTLTGGNASGTWTINVTGNAGSATRLINVRTINGTGFDGQSNIDTTEWVHSDRDFPNGTLISTSINYAVSSGDPFVLEIRGNSYGNGIPLDIQYQGYIYSDTIINHGGLANGLNISGLVALNVGGNLCFWFPSQGYWNGYNVKVYTAYATRAVNRVTTITHGPKPSGTKEVGLTANIRQSLHSGNYLSYSLMRYAGVYTGNWQGLTDEIGELRVDQVNDINNGAHSNQPPSVYTYGGVLSWRTHNHSFQLYASHIGDLTFKTQWNDDNASGWRRILHESNYNSFAPTLTGGGASGTWGINITGNAGYASNSGALNGYGSSSGGGGDVVLRTASNGYLYLYNWINTAGAGLFSSVNGAHFYPNNGTYGSWRADGTRNNYNGMEFGGLNNGSVSLMIHVDSNISGTHNQSHGWQWQWTSGTLYCFKNAYGGGTQATVLDSSNYTSYSPSLGGSGASGTWGINITGNADTAYGLAVHGGRNNEANKVVRTDGNGYLQTGYINSSNGDENNASSPARVWGTNGSDSYLRTYQTSSLSVGSATNGRYVYDNGAYSGSAAYREASSMHVYYSYLGRLVYNNGAYSGSGWVEASDLGVRYAGRAQRANGNFYIDDNYGNGIVGLYASTRYQGVFAMGDSYKLPADGTGPGNLYGLAWSYPSAGGVAGNLDSHGLLVLINGGLGSAISYSIVAAGNVTAYSDERLKTNWRPMPENFVERLAQVKSGIYDRIDGEQITQVGIGAQSFQRLLPEAITKAKDEMGTLSVSYGNAAMASAVELAKEIVAIKRELEALKARLH
jgi:hypothetical protein